MAGALRRSAESYWLGAVLAVAAFPILCWPIIAEAAQHALEMHLGMFVPGDGIAPGYETYLRGAVGLVKVVATLYVTLLGVRYFVHGNNVGAAVALEAGAVRAVLAAVVVVALLVVAVIFAGPLLSGLLREYVPALPRAAVAFVVMALLVGPIFLAPGSVSRRWTAQILGDRSFDVSHKRGRVPLVPVIISALPLMVLHYVLNWAAVGGTIQQQILILAADSRLVGFMAAVQASALWVAYRDWRGE